MANILSTIFWGGADGELKCEIQIDTKAEDETFNQFAAGLKKISSIPNAGMDKLLKVAYHGSTSVSVQDTLQF